MGTPAAGPQVWGNPDQMFNLSEALISKTEDYIRQLAGAATGIFAPTITPNFPSVSAAPAPVTASLPALQSVTWTVPTAPVPFNGTLNIQGLLPGPFTGAPPALNFGSPPAPFNQLVPSAPPIDLNFTYPAVDVTLPVPPSLLALDTVAFPALSIPGFAASVPQLTVLAPNTIRYVEGALFSSALLTQLEADLEHALSEGTWTGLPSAAEQALWDRAREREYRQMADAFAELDRMEAMGFSAPPGVYFDARLKLQTEMQNTTAGLSREVMIKQAELQLENITKARENATALESKLIDYTNQVSQRTFESARYATEASISIYNAQVQAFTASLEGFKTQALVYDTQVKGLLAQVEVTKAQIAFEHTKALINKEIVAQYRAEVEASEAIIEIFKAQVQIIQTQASVEKIKIEAFAEQIKAYVGQINAYTAQVEGYKANAEAQGVIESVFKTQVDAFTAQVSAGVAESNALVAQYRGQVEAYTAQIEAYKGAVQAMVGQAQAASLFNTAEAEVYRAQVAALSSYNDTLTKQWEAVINEQEKVAEVGISAAKANGDLYIAARGLSLDATKVGAQVAAQLGAAALGAIHWANNSSWTDSNSFSIQSSTSNSTSEITESITSA